MITGESSVAHCIQRNEIVRLTRYSLPVATLAAGVILGLSGCSDSSSSASSSPSPSVTLSAISVQFNGAELPLGPVSGVGPDWTPSGWPSDVARPAGGTLIGNTTVQATTKKGNPTTVLAYTVPGTAEAAITAQTDVLKALGWTVTASDATSMSATKDGHTMTLSTQPSTVPDSITLVEIYN